MEHLDFNIPEEELQKFEKKYNEAKSNNQLTDTIQFDYAWCLVRSQNSLDIKRGIAELNKLCKNNIEDRRDYMYYLAIGYFRLHDYNKALEFLDQILKREPTNHQVLLLKKAIADKKQAKNVQEVATGAGLVAILGGIALVAFGVGKKLSG